MPSTLRGVLTVLGRLLICGIFMLSALGNKIPNYSGVVEYMRKEGVPAPEILLAGAIVFLIAGSLSIILGFRARIGASLLLVFLALATYYFHDFWTFTGAEQQQQQIQFFKNASMAGTMIFLIANGSGPWSLDDRLSSQPKLP